MNNISQVKTQLFTGVEFISVISALTIIFIVYLNRKKISKTWRSYKTRYCLNHLGLEQISNIQCPDGLGNSFNIDRLILRHNGITLLVYKKYPGKIFCADHIDEWTQMLDQKSYKFNNPLFDLDHQIKSISACVEDVPVNGYLFFDHTAEFPKGHPDRVMHPQSIPDELQRNNRHQVEPGVMSAWKKLQVMAASQ